MVLVVLVLVALVVAASPVRAEDGDIPAVELRRLLQVIRYVKAEYVTPVEDARLAGGCASRLRVGGAAAAAAELSQIPPLLRRAATEAAADVPYSSLVNDCLSGMLAALDARSEFLSPETFGQTRRDSLMSTASVGVEVKRGEGAVEIVRVIEGGPARAAGLAAGDRLVEIDGWLVSGATLDAVVGRLRGLVGTPVVLVVERAGTRHIFTVQREHVSEQSVSLRALDGGVWHLRVWRIREETVRDVEQATGRALAQGGPPRLGIVLDLRDNPGGLLGEMVDLASAFLREGLLVGQTEGRTPRSSQKYVTRARIPRALGADSPPAESVTAALRAATLVVLVNGTTTSGAEMATAALQFHGRARVAGAPSAGVGTIQSIHALGGNGGGIRLTTARWLGPGGQPLETRPVVPDVLIATARGPVERVGESTAADTALAQAIEVLRQPPAARPR
jgi:carboxyl-terminal processing protease